MTSLKEKTEYVRGKVIKVEEWFKKNKIPFNPGNVVAQANINAIKKVLIDNNLVTEEEYENIYMEEDLKLLQQMKEYVQAQKSKSKLIVPNAVIPKDLRKVNA